MRHIRHGCITQIAKESKMKGYVQYKRYDKTGYPVLDVSSLLTYEDVVVLAENGLMDEEGYLVSDIDQYLVEQENYELNEVLKKLKSAAKKAGKHVWKHKKKYAAGAALAAVAVAGGKKLKDKRQNRRNELAADAANQRLADDEAKAEADRKAKAEAENQERAARLKREKEERERKANEYADEQKRIQDEISKKRARYGLSAGLSQVDAKGNLIDRKGNEKRKELLKNKQRARGQAKLQYQAADNIPTVKGHDDEAQKGWEKRMTKRGANLATGNAPVVDNKTATRRETEDADSTSPKTLSRLEKHKAKKAKKEKGRAKARARGDRVENYRNSNIDYQLRTLADAYLDQVVNPVDVEETTNQYAESIKESLKSRLASAGAMGALGATFGAAQHVGHWSRDRVRHAQIKHLKNKKKLTRKERATLKALQGDKMQDAYYGRKLGKKELVNKMLGYGLSGAAIGAIKNPMAMAGAGQSAWVRQHQEFEPEGESIDE